MRLTAAGLSSLLLLLGTAACGSPQDDAHTSTHTHAAAASPATDSASPVPTPSETDEGTEERAAEKAKPKVKPKPVRTYLVTRVVDGDTVELGNGQTVRVVGIDTPERGQCGYDPASEHLAGLVLYKQVRLTVSDEDTDHYGRLLRYVDVRKDGQLVDAGLNQIRSGFAIARYDSRDGYGYHTREPLYIRADHRSKPFTCAAPAASPAPTQGGGCHPGYTPCLPLVADLDCGDVTGPVHVTGDDPYRLDADGDGTGCDS
jgi:endonuclease YncB( thermonuclease family)